MPRRCLPPLSSLRAFEAAARHANFASAANELCVTPTAISQQVRQLEEWLAVRLFIRHARGVEITATGAEYALTVKQLLDQLACATERVRPAKQARTLSIWTTPAFAAHWLVPRMYKFMLLHPALNLRLITAKSIIDITKDGVDVAVVYGRGNWPGWKARFLASVELIPVCSPAFCVAKRLRVPADLHPRSLLRLVGDDWLAGHEARELGKVGSRAAQLDNLFRIHDRWSAWLTTAGLGEMTPEGPQYSDAGLLVHAARAGHGVALVQKLIVNDDLAAGRLIELFPLRIPSRAAYYLVDLSQEFDRQSEVAAFGHWLVNELDVQLF